MEFAVLSRLSAILFTPGNLLLWALLVGVALTFTRHVFAARVILVFTAIAALLVAALPLQAWLARPLEDRYPRGPMPPLVSGILVLSPGPNTTIFAARGVPATERSGRFLAAADLLRRYPAAKLVYSGGIAPLVGGAEAETIVARNLFAQMGIPASRIIWEESARNTWENFTRSRALVTPRPGEIWIVVTSAINMPRAMEIAARLCWSVLPWPSDYVSTGKSENLGVIDFAGRLSELDTVAHEWLGLAAYRLTGRAGACVR